METYIKCIPKREKLQNEFGSPFTVLNGTQKTLNGHSLGVLKEWENSP